MRIIILGPAHPLRGGIAQFNERLAIELQQMGHHISVFSFSRQYPDLLFPGKTQFDTGAGPKGLDIRPVLDSINPFNWMKVARMIREERPDLIIVRYWLPFMAPCLGTVLKWAHAPRVVAITDNVIPHEHRMGDRTLTRYFLNECHGFVAMSGTVLKELDEFDTTKPRKLIHHPVYDHFGEPMDKVMARRQLGLRTTGRLVVFFGLVREYKGLDLLIAALADPRLQDVNLFIAGEAYGDRKQYQDQIFRLGLIERVVWRNEFIANEVVSAVFCAADVVVQPYRTASQSGVTQIAYHFGRPMIVTDVGGLPEMVTHGHGALVCSPDAEALADSIHTFYDQGLEGSFSQMVRLESARFSWRAMAEGVISTVM